MTLPGGASSHTPIPLSSQTVAVTAMNWAIPPAIARNPNTRNGSVFDARWSQPWCSSGAKITPSRWLGSRAMMPSSSSSARPVLTSYASIT